MERRSGRFRSLATTAALAAAAGLAMGLLLPPAARVVDVPPGSRPGAAVPDRPDGGFVRTARGVYHVHSRRSDGSGTVLEIAAAAAAAGLDFVVLTDHGDATGIASPAYYDGVLMIDGVEVSTDGGHYAAVGLEPAPYPLGGDARGVVEDVRRLGGFGIAAHPMSPKPALAWSDPSLPVDAVEWINGDTAWRDGNWGSLLRAFFGYWIRSPESLASMLSRPEEALALWDELASQRRVVGIGAVDAHARLTIGEEDESYGGEGVDDDGAATGGLPWPGYEPVFRTLSVQVELDRALTGRAPADTTAIVSSLREGRVYTVVDAVAAPARIAWNGRAAGGQVIRMGEWTAGDDTVALTARVAGPDDATFTLRRNGAPVVADAPGPTLRYRTPVAPDEWTAYRIEVFLPGAPGNPPIPWIVSNPIYVGGASSGGFDPFRGTSAASGGPAEPAGPVQGRPLALDWRVEQRDAEVSLTSDVLRPGGEVAGAEVAGGEVAGAEVRMTFELGSDAETYAAAVHAVEAGGLVGATAVRFDAEASRPMRLSLQLRRGDPAGGEGDRWRRSFYVSPERRSVTVPFDQLAPVTPDLDARPDLAAIDSLLIVVDTVNTFPGARGVLTIAAPHLVAP